MSLKILVSIVSIAEFKQVNDACVVDKFYAMLQ